MLYAIAYDLPSSKRRNKVAKLLAKYGVRMQYSLFECELNSVKLKNLLKSLAEIIDPKHDSVFLYKVICKGYKSKITMGISYDQIFINNLVR